MASTSGRLVSAPSPSRMNSVHDNESGDGNISRKISACAACRKQKIKCHMTNSKPPCTRCRKRKLPCTINRNLQTILEDDVAFKSAVVDKIALMESTLSRVAGKLGVPDHFEGSNSSPMAETVETTHSQLYNSPSTRMSNRLNQSWDVTLEGEAVVPGSCVVETSASVQPSVFSNVSTSGKNPDLIEKGIITLGQAQRLFHVYHSRLDHFLYRILGDHESFEGVRASSAILIAATCTVGALHADESLSFLFQRCYHEFLALSAGQTFSKRNTIDDIRGLCIGAFWLCEISWILVGIAVRIATEMQLHQSMHRALEGDRPSYLQARLYFLVYVCDHHFSIAYGRPPMTRDFEAVYDADSLLKLEFATEDDARLVSQVKMWSIGTRVFDAFGANVHRPVSAESLPQMRRLSIALDTWRADWSDRFRPNPQIGNYPRKGVSLHYHFAKLYLYSHAFRGLSSSRSVSGLGPDMEEIANGAVLSAKSILRNVMSDAELQSYLNGLPLYFDTMIAFAAVFLLKVAVNYYANINVDVAEIFALIEDVVGVLKQISSSMHRQHLLVHIAAGAEKLLERCKQEPPDAQMTMQEEYLSTNGNSTLDQNLFDAGWSPLNSTWLENYDLLSSQVMASGLDSWSLDFNFDQPSAPGMI